MACGICIPGHFALARVRVVCPADLGDSAILEEVEKSVGVHLCSMSLSRDFRCGRYGCVVVLWDVNWLRIDVKEPVVDLVKIVSKQ